MSHVEGSVYKYSRITSLPWSVIRPSLDILKPYFDESLKMELEFGDLVAEGNIEGIIALQQKYPALSINQKIFEEYALTLACWNGDYSMVKFLIQQGAQERSQRNDGSTGLFLAIERRHEHLLNLLITKGSDALDFPLRDGTTPIVYCLEKGMVSVARKLIMAGANVEFVRKDHSDLLHIAARSGFDESFWFILNERIGRIVSKNSERETLLHSAVQGQNQRILKEILGMKKIDVNARTVSGGTAALFAARAGWSPGVRFLFENGADLTICNNKKQNVIHAACEAGSSETFEYLLSVFGVGRIDLSKPDIYGTTSIFFAARSGNVDLFKRLLELHVPTTAISVSGKTLLMAACQGGSVPIVRLLVEVLQDRINASTVDGKTALMFACEEGRASVVDFLLANGASVNMITTGTRCFEDHMIKNWQELLDPSRVSEGATAMHFAARGGYTYIIKRLFEHGAEMDVRAKSFPIPIRSPRLWSEYATPLWVACNTGNTESIRYLMANDANIHLRGGPRFTLPLHEAIASRSIAHAIWLIAAGSAYRKPNVAYYYEARSPPPGARDVPGGRLYPTTYRFASQFFSIEVALALDRLARDLEMLEAEHLACSDSPQAPTQPPQENDVSPPRSTSPPKMLRKPSNMLPPSGHGGGYFRPPPPKIVHPELGTPDTIVELDVRGPSDERQLKDTVRKAFTELSTRLDRVNEARTHSARPSPPQALSDVGIGVTPLKSAWVDEVVETGTATRKFLSIVVPVLPNDVEKLSIFLEHVRTVWRDQSHLHLAKIVHAVLNAHLNAQGAPIVEYALGILREGGDVFVIPSLPEGAILKSNKRSRSFFKSTGSEKDFRLQNGVDDDDYDDDDAIVGDNAVLVDHEGEVVTDDTPPPPAKSVPVDKSALMLGGGGAGVGAGKGKRKGKGKGRVLDILEDNGVGRRARKSPSGEGVEDEEVSDLSEMMIKMAAKGVGIKKKR